MPPAAQPVPHAAPAVGQPGPPAFPHPAVPHQAVPHQPVPPQPVLPQPAAPEAGLLADSPVGELFAGPPPQRQYQTRSEARRAERRRKAGVRRGRRVLSLALAALVVVILIVGAAFYPRVRDAITTPDYSGSGSGSVTVVVAPNQSASAIAQSLHSAGVVKSTKAFIKAADANPDSRNIQAGTYTLRKRMSGAAALAMLLDPSAKSADSNLLIVEGDNMVAVRARMVKALGAAAEPAIAKALADVPNSGVPLGYAPDGSKDGLPTSLEGFLYPATYPIATTDSPASVIGQMTAAFIAQDRASGFAEDAAAAGLTPYQALIVASIAQSEAKFPEDMAKVARVILNRLAANKPLQIDATSVYGAEITGVDPATIQYDTFVSPFNTYLHNGLTPTPISNPGADALDGAVHPAAGNWLWYVNGDAEGHLAFTNSEAQFEQLRQKCHDNGWGCA